MGGLGTSQIASGGLGLVLNCNRELGVFLSGSSRAVPPLKLRWGTWCSCREVVGNLELQPGTQSSSGFGGNSGFISCCSVGSRVTLRGVVGDAVCSPVVMGLSIELSRGQLVSAGMCRMARLAAMRGWLLTSSGMIFFS